MAILDAVIKNNGSQVWICFDTEEKREQFLETLKNDKNLLEEGCIHARQFFNYLNTISPYPAGYGWYIDDIKSISSTTHEHVQGHPYYLSLVHAQKLDKRTAKLILGVMAETKKNIPGIDDGGERIRYGENGAFREPADGKGRFDLISPFALQRLARWYELGAKKYADRNWEKGIPFSRYMDSAMRHLTKYMMGMKDEDHLAAAAWNITCIMHHEEVGQMELDDLPHYCDNLSEVNKLLEGCSQEIVEKSGDIVD